jgi:hypothetical protein
VIGLPAVAGSTRISRMATAAIGFATHTGWVAAVALKGGRQEVAVAGKARIVMADRFEEGAVYHASEGRPPAEAEALIRKTEARCLRRGTKGLADLLTDLRAAGCTAVTGAVVAGGGRALPALETILRSHALIHAAEGELYRRLAVRMCEELEIPVMLVARKELPARAAAALRCTPAQLAARLALLGKSSGPPWARDQKESATAALLALAT